MSKPRVTAWFSPNVKPVHIGVYQQMCGLGKTLGYQYWNGAFWLGWCATVDEAARETIPAFRNDPWRGIRSARRAGKTPDAARLPGTNGSGVE